MPSGGPRARSGPAPDPNSARSDARGLILTDLPIEGYQGKPPRFPLPQMDLSFRNEAGLLVEDADGSKSFARRERALWKWVWSTPQAIAWAREPWRHYAVAQWVRQSVICESAGAKAADKTAMLRLADQIGLTPAGLVLNGWKIVAQIAPAEQVSVKPEMVSSRSKMKMVRGG